VLQALKPKPVRGCLQATTHLGLGFSELFK